MRTMWMVLGLLFLSSAALQAAPVDGDQQEQPLRRVRLWSDDGATAAQELEDAGYDVLYGTITVGSVDLVVSVAEQHDLEAAGYRLELVEVGRPFSEIQAEQTGRDPESLPTGYQNVEEIVAEMTAVAAAYPSICRLVDLTTEYDVAPTYEGRHIYAVKISDNVMATEDEPGFMMVSCHHAREVVTPVLALAAIDKLTSQYGSDPTITQLVDDNEIWIAPLWNPDGYHHVYYVDNWWRKNRHVVTGGIGIDLNRNYPQGWYNACSGSSNPGSDTFKGTSPASEAESQTMLAWSEQERFAKIIDYHSSGREALYGYDCWSHPFENFHRNEAIDLSYASGYGGSVRGPSADGEHYQWQWGKRGAHAFLIETHYEFQPSYASALQEAETVWPGTVWMLQRPIPLWGHVTSSSGEPLEAEIILEGITFSHEEENWSGGPFGRYHAFVPAGTYTVRVEAEGYESQTVSNVQVTAGGSTQLDVVLTNPMAVAAGPEAGPKLLLSCASPQRGSGLVRFELPLPARATLRVHDIRGGVVRTLIDAALGAGGHEARWDGADAAGRPAPAGSYFYRLTAGETSASRRLLLLR